MTPLSPTSPFSAPLVPARSNSIASGPRLSERMAPVPDQKTPPVFDITNKDLAKADRSTAIINYTPVVELRNLSGNVCGFLAVAKNASGLRQCTVYNARGEKVGVIIEHDVFECDSLGFSAPQLIIWNIHDITDPGQKIGTFTQNTTGGNLSTIQLEDKRAKGEKRNIFFHSEYMLSPIDCLQMNRPETVGPSRGIYKGFSTNPNGDIAELYR